MRGIDVEETTDLLDRSSYFISCSDARVNRYGGCFDDTRRLGHILLVIQPVDVDMLPLVARSIRFSKKKKFFFFFHRVP